MPPPLNVYLSSPYKQLEIARGEFLDLMQSRKNLYQINGMERYYAADEPPLKKCLEDVDRCNIYVLIVADNYGSIARIAGQNNHKSYTHLEYDRANERVNNRQPVERLIFVKTPAAPDEPKELTDWKAEINGLRITKKNFKDPSELPKLIQENLDDYAGRMVSKAIQPKENLDDLIYLCDRQPVEDEFDFAVSTNNSPTSFFVLSSHEYNLPYYFFERTKIKSTERKKSWCDINIQLSIPEKADDFVKAEFSIKNGIFRKLGWNKFRTPEDITPEGLIACMTEMNIDYLAIIWQIKNVSLKNSKLGGFLNALSDKYQAAFKNIVTDKKIFFFSILSYTPGSDISEDDFYKKANIIKWRNKLPVLSKITVQDIKDWMYENEIEDLETKKEELIKLCFENFNNTEGVFFKDAEPGLLKILERYKNNKF